MEEVWKDVIGYEGLYEVSNMGRVKTLKYGKSKILKNINHNQGYKMVRLYIDGKGKTIKVHRLVALAFIDKNLPSNHKLVVDHIDNDKQNNCLSNLQIITTRENNSKEGRYQLGTSKYIGVYWSKSKNRFLSYIHFGKKKITVGSFKCETAAHIKREEKLKLLLSSL